MESNLRSFFPSLALDQVCKSYHEHAELAINNKNADTCNQSLKHLDRKQHIFCGYSEDIYPYGENSLHVCSEVARTEAECNSSRRQATLKCKWLTPNDCYWNGTHCDNRSSLDYIISSIEFANRTCGEISTRSICENVTLESGLCSVSSKTSSSLYPEYQNFCSNVSNSHECKSANLSLNSTCKWYYKQLDRFSSNECCRVSSPWCDEIDRYFNFVNEDILCKGELTCRDISGPNASATRSRYSETESKRIDGICCSDLKNTNEPIQLTFSPTNAPTKGTNALDVHVDHVTTLQDGTSYPSFEIMATTVPSPAKSVYDSVSQSPSHYMHFHDDTNNDENSTISVHLEVYSAQSSSLVATANIGLFTVIPVMTILAVWIRKYRGKAKNSSAVDDEVLDPSQYEHVLSDSFDIAQDVEDQVQFEYLPTDYEYQYVLDDSYDVTRHNQKPFEPNAAIDDSLDDDVMFPSLSDMLNQDDEI